MSEENKKKLGEQLIRCILDDKLDKDVKLRKMDYIIKMGADINARHEFGYSALGLAKAMKNEEIISFLEGKGAEDIGLDKEKAEKFFRTASVDDINKFLNVLPDGFVLDCDVDLSERELKELPDFSKVIVKGVFYCDENQLDSLKGAPRKVGESFVCCGNQLVSLEGVPSEVRGDFDCSHNQLESLKGAPSMVGDNFYCYGNQLTTLEGAPSIVGGDFDCHNNQLTSLKGAPSEVGKSFECDSNKLVSLRGAPRKVGRYFNCSRNQLDSLEGAPSEVGKDFYCNINQLTSLEGGPRIVEGNFDCSDNPLKSYKGKPDKIGGEFIAPSIEQINNINGGIGR